MSELVPSLGDEEEAVYRLLVSTGGAERTRIADALGWESARADRALGTLRHVGLVRGGVERGGTCVAVDPAAAASQFARPLEGAIRAWQAQVEGIRGRLSALSDVYAAGARPGDTVVQVRNGADLIAVLDETADGCTGEAVVVRPLGKGAPALAAHAVARDTALLSRGVRVRSVFPHLARYDAGARGYVEAVSGLRGEVRTAVSALPALIVFDRSVAFLLDDESGTSAQRLTNPALVGFVMQAVEIVWAGGETFTAVTGGNPMPDQLAGETKERIVQLLAAGYKDEVVARQLGIALRTCRKYIAEIFDDLGAQSRFQAGWLVRERLARRGHQTTRDATGDRSGGAVQAVAASGAA
jgi:DNA-binding NarL/FixJ family response regulator